LDKNKIFSIVLKLCSVAIVLCTLLSLLAVNTSAESLPGVPYTTYTYWEGYGSKKPVEIKATHEVYKILDGAKLDIGNFSELQHSFSYNNQLYILDSGNGRIVIFDKDYNVTDIITSFKYGKEKLQFKGAKGLFVDESGLYLADTANKRILCTKDGVVTHIIERPVDTSIPETLEYSPSRLVKDSSGYLYALCEGSYYGMMVFSETYEFFGFFGANNVETNFFNAITSWVSSLFETEAKHNASLKQLPYALTDICLDSEGLIIGINDGSTGQIKRFGLLGTNTLKKNNDFSTASTDTFNFVDSPYMFRDKTLSGSVFYTSKFTALAADDNGYYYAVDNTHGRVFIYDDTASVISVFGGGKQVGDQTGTFSSVSSAAIFGEDIIITDFITGKITVFRKTEYGKVFMTANSYTVDSDYIAAKPYWEQINGVDKNNQLAWRGLGKAYLTEKNYSKAMSYAKSGVDRETYSKAFSYVRDEFISKNFWWITVLALGAVVGILVFIIKSKKDNIIVIKNPKLRIAVRTFYHPFESFDLIKNKGMGSVPIAIGFLIVFYISSILCKLNSGFMFGVVDLSNFNSILVLLGSIGIVLLWAVSNWLVAVLFEGKGKMKEIICATCYSLTPMIIYNFSYLILSHVLIPSANSPFELFSSVCYLLTGVLLLLSITVLHDFSFFKAIAIAIVSVIAMAIVVFLLFLILTLSQDLISFVIGIINEIALR